MRGALLVAIVLLAGCTRGPGPSPGPDAPGEAWHAGTVRVVGSAPMSVQVVLQPETGSQVALTGPLAAELQAVRGARVAVRGKESRGVLEATDYVVQEVDGRPVVMGTLEAAADGGLQLRTAAGEVIHLSGATDELRAGQKVWVQGVEAVRVQSYGVIRP